MTEAQLKAVGQMPNQILAQWPDLEQHILTLKRALRAIAEAGTEMEDGRHIAFHFLVTRENYNRMKELAR
jgi:hypothetical protein